MKNINRVVAAKFYLVCKMGHKKLTLSFFKVGDKGGLLFKHVIVERTSQLEKIMKEHKKAGYVCAGATKFDNNENATLFTTCRMCRTEGMFDKVVETDISFILSAMD